MNKMLPSFMIITIVMFLATAPIHALTIKVNENGSMIVQQGDVLGDDSEQEHENKQEDSTKQKEERKQEDKKDEQKNEQEKKAVESTREIQKKATEQQREESKIIRNINSGENKQVRVTNRKQKTEVLIENKKTDHQENETLSSQEKISTDRLNLELPAHPEVETEAESDNEDISQVKKERQQRRDKLEIQTQIQDDGTQEIQIEAGATKATLRSAEFTIDPATNTVLITTPNGEKHELVHLPDQVLQKFTDRGLLDSNDSAAQSALSIETDNEGNVVYRTKTKHTRHILGLIPYEVENEVELNDANGETSTQPVDSSLISRLLLGLSR